MTLDERLLAYVDGELSGEELAKFEAEMAADARLRTEVEKHRGLAKQIAVARAERAEAARSKRAKAGKPVKTPPQGRFGALHGAAILAGLAIGGAAGAAGGHYLWPQPGPLTAAGGMLLASGDLARALDDQATAEKAPISIGATFRTASGRYCRTFTSPADQLAGLACRGSQSWVLQTTTVLGETAGMPRAVLAAQRGLIAGAPLDEAAERAARLKGWK